MLDRQNHKWCRETRWFAAQPAFKYSIVARQLLEFLCRAILISVHAKNGRSMIMAQPKSTKPRIHFSMFRTYQLADLITLANGAAGMAGGFGTVGYVKSADNWGFCLA